MHTKDKLAEALLAASLPIMAVKATEGYYHDFLSPRELPAMQLCDELTIIGTPAALALRERVMAGEFDASQEEGEAWAASEDGQEIMRRLAYRF